MYTNVHCNTVYNSNDLELTKIPIDNRLDLKKWYIYVMEYYITIKKNEIMSFAGTWMEPKAIIHSKLMREQKAKYCMF